MDWEKTYKKKLTTADEAVKHIMSGDRVVAGHACGSPDRLLKAMVANKLAYRNVEIVHMMDMGYSEYCLPENSDHFIHNSLFAGPASRAMINDGRGKFTPCHFSRIPHLFKDRILPVDVALCMVSTPDEHGFCSFGVSVDYTKPAAESAKIVIAQVTPHMPRTLGSSFIHVSEIDHIVECDDRPISMPNAEITPADEAIGKHCAQLIKDGDCLQLGIGAVPNAILAFLKDKIDLGIHTEMFSDGVVDLVKAGVITCRKKNIHQGRMVATFFMGTQKLYDFVHNNPCVEMFPVDYTNNPFVIAQNDNFVSVNSAIQADFTGQVVSDTLGSRQYSGTGGQVDFIRGAAMSRGGRAILAFHATAARGTVSRIVPFINQGASVTTSRADVHCIVTEYGVADLRGRSVAERAEALINIAHPDFRSGLQAEFELTYNRKLLSPKVNNRETDKPKTGKKQARES
ncbi:MAG: acetyl-CoA hydrolase/transferase C-terminal domain-containing protein [Pseudomonadota bacterium]